MTTSPDRRSLLGWLGAGASATFLAACGSSQAQAKTYPVSMSTAQWRKKLSPQEFAVLRKAATERPFSSPLLKEERTGTFVCAGCANPIYSSKTKFDSGTGWPSFWAAKDGAIDTKSDYSIGIPRTEAHCARCGGHLGHIFNDGPKPTGKRHCINGVAMNFLPA